MDVPALDVENIMKLPLLDSVVLGDRIYKCAYCQKPFTQKRYQTRHELHQCLSNPKNSKGNKAYTCEVCQASYSLRKTLNFHIKHDCSRIHKCQHCGMTFLQYSTLTTHFTSGSCKMSMYYNSTD